MAPLHLPERAGCARPQTGPSVPHVQFTQTSPPTVREALRDWMSTALPDVVAAPSEISDPAKMTRWVSTAFPDLDLPHDLPGEEALGLFLDGIGPADGAVLMPPRLTAEFAHLHPDGSLHLSLATGDQQELIGKGWGERHPLHSAQINVVMLYGPRTDEELAVARAVIRAAYRYATGRDDAAADDSSRRRAAR